MVKLLGHLKIRVHFIVLGLALTACTENIPKLNYNKIEKGGDSIDLCEIYDAPWDSILIIPPYARESLWKNIKNINSIKAELNQMESIDWKNYLIILNGETAIAYMEIPRKYLDFDFKNEIVKKVIYKENCILESNNGKLVIPTKK